MFKNINFSHIHLVQNLCSVILPKICLCNIVSDQVTIADRIDFVSSQ